MENVKTVIVDLREPKKKRGKKEETVLENEIENDEKAEEQIKKRVITNTIKWNFTEEELELERQFTYIKQIQDKNIVNREQCEMIKRLIHTKLYGYRSQDTHKGLFDEEKFIKEERVFELLNECENRCFYCKELVNVLYEQVREQKQWTLDRLDNDYGHNDLNVVIACLGCNLRRKTMYHERYVFTKQLNIIKT
jgi:hypothetical protein